MINNQEFLNQKISNDILLYIKEEKLFDIDASKIKIIIEKIGGVTNKNFSIKVMDISNSSFPKILAKYFYKYFKEEKNAVTDRKAEANIVRKLGELNLGPKLLKFDEEKENFRIDEYCEGFDNLKEENHFAPSVIDQLINILVNYSSISNLYKYEINKEKNEIKFDLSKSKINSNKSYKFDINNNFYNQYFIQLYPKAKENFNKFKNDFIQDNKNEYEVYIQQKEKNNKKFEELFKCEYYINNFIEIILDLIPKDGYLVLSQNDVHKTNMLHNKNTDKLYLIDHEFIDFNLIGFDILTYVFLTCFNAVPYYFKPEEIDYEKYLNIYKKFVDKFVCFYSNFWEKFEKDTFEYKYFSEIIRTKKFFYKMLSAKILSGTVYLSFCLNYEKEFGKDKDKNFPFLKSQIDNLWFYERTIEELKKFE